MANKEPKNISGKFIAILCRKLMSLFVYIFLSIYLQIFLGYVKIIILAFMFVG